MVHIPRGFFILVLCVCCLPAAGQQPANEAKSAQPGSVDGTENASRDSALSQNSQEITVFHLVNVEANKMLRVLNELGYGQNTSIAVHPSGQSLIVRGPMQEIDEIKALVLQLDEPVSKLGDKESKKISAVFNVEYPKNAVLRWVGGQGGITQSILGLNCSIPVGGSNKLWLSKIPGHEKLSVIAVVEVPQIDAETAAILRSTSTAIRITADDLEQVASGVAVTKLITGPHDLATSGKGLFEEVVSYRLPAGASSITDVEKAGHVVGVIRLTGGLRDDAIAADITQATTTEPPIIAELKAQRAELTESKISELTKDFAQVEDRIAEISQTLRSEDAPQPASATQLRQQLLELLSSAFKLRQQLQLYQIDLQRTKLDALRDRVLRREKISQQIIDQRFEDLNVGKSTSSLKSKTLRAIDAAQSTGGDVSVTVQPKIDILTVRGKKQDVESVLKAIDSSKKEN